MTRLLFAATIFCSAFLLFLIQPIVSKHILPWFGGSASVWATCMVFFQVTLLAGYAYADWITRHLPPRLQAGLHLSLLAVSALTFSVLAGPDWKPHGSEDPAWRILLLLSASIGLPYFLLSTTGPLIQAWASRLQISAAVYRFYSLSNLASLAALVSYPFLIEPHAAVSTQASVWSGGYVLFTLLCTGCTLSLVRRAAAGSVETEAGKHAADEPAPGWRRQLLWLALSAAGSWLLLAVTNHITQNIAAIPFLWLLPLTLYLLSFVLCFESDRWYARRRFMLPTALVLGACAWGLQNHAVAFNAKLAVPLYAGGLFLACMCLHGELAQMRPAPRHLTRFYLMLSLGGAIGGIGVGLLAPRLLASYYELGLGLAAAALLALLLPRRTLLLAGGAAALALFCGFFLTKQISQGLREARRMERSFYGALRTQDVLAADGRSVVRQFLHGSIKHGEQYLAAERRREPTTYYGPDSGIGLALDLRQGPRRLGLIGLGTGTLAAYGRKGDVFRFYELDPHVLHLAQTEFSFMRDSAARIETVMGDARLSMEKEAPQGFDILAVDAFSGDAIPVHLLTREAIALYLRHVKPDGIIAFHVTNRFLALAPVVERLAEEAGLASVLISDDAEGTGFAVTDWVLVSRDAQALNDAFDEASSPIESIPGLGVWRDDYNNLFQVLK
ncbi:hypothetical protein SAMN06265795_1177 [Noviherbaspirillum humi]|uniref:Spermidine synthase n=1 Tax=Noviherbaspirillum humi TaxID=1688639 RepID=A0A239KRT1_9BURK|nr:fused MFS/spermidine synthase [Noviherbaspirillum humi]SNT20378.1 hypothetical protein SAMN06265795_1177 [Noviherbaspirillum humi]